MRDMFDGFDQFNDYGAYSDRPSVPVVEPITLDDEPEEFPAPASAAAPARAQGEQPSGTRRRSARRPQEEARPERRRAADDRARERRAADQGQKDRQEEDSKPELAIGGDMVVEAPEAAAADALPPSLLDRMRSGAIYITVNVLCILVHPLATAIMLAATAGLCSHEFFDMMRGEGKRKPYEIIGIVAAAAYPLAAYLLDFRGVMVVTALLIVTVSGWYVFSERSDMSDMCTAVYGAVYVGLQLSTFMFIRQGVPGMWGGLALLVVFAAVWISDIAAYLVGSKIGWHKMAPRLSPKKSWEGFAAGLIASMLVWCLLVPIPGVNVSIGLALVGGLLCGIAGVLGDLCESHMKRNAGVKDSGTLLPGHGGMFDRSDSLISTAVVAAIVLLAGGCIPFAL